MLGIVIGMTIFATSIIVLLILGAITFASIFWAIAAVGVGDYGSLVIAVLVACVAGYAFNWLIDRIAVFRPIAAP